ncbi:MAG: signal recognition particle-docking protein FtsY [Alphaproteobacteria bacterium]|nr:signal recognition particle-docking protein FtsY [Alphaproteobacteria bacterium]
MRWLDKLKKGLQKTARVFSFKSLNLDDLEETLLMADVGVKLTDEILTLVREKNPKDVDEMRQILRQVFIDKMQSVARPLSLPQSQPAVVLMIGVNGAGKTTSIGKLSQMYINQGKSVAVVAADTFRAGAVEQLKKWAEKTGADFYSGAQGCDAAGLIYDALNDARKKKTDVVFVDTAGRLQNRTDLMDELKKIGRVIRKVDENMPHECILVLDATVGQNALSQVKIFNETAPLTGLIMTKLDGTAKGGVLLSLADRFQLPIYAVGVGESVDDLNPFSAEEYADSLLGV